MKPTVVEFAAGYHHRDESAASVRADLLDALQQARKAKANAQMIIRQQARRIESLRQSLDRCRVHCAQLARSPKRRRRAADPDQQLSLLLESGR